MSLQHQYRASVPNLSVISSPISGNSDRYTQGQTEADSTSVRRLPCPWHPVFHPVGLAYVRLISDAVTV